jgi:enoyl-CoA hydratase
MSAGTGTGGSGETAETVEVERLGAVTVVTINRPERRNALDPAAMSGLGRALAAAELDDAVRCVVLTGAGEKAFCAGMDLRAFAEGGISPDDLPKPGLEVLIERVYPKPVVAAVNGAALAAGFELVMACDLVVAAQHALFGLPEVKRGLVAAGGGTRLPLRVPLAVALEIGLTGEPVDAARAHALGLVNRVVPAADVRAEALALAEAIAANGPLAVAATKELMRAEAAGLSIAAVGARAKPVFESEDAREGALAFAQRRAPVWRNR